MDKINANTHSPIGASGMHRWAVCPGSVELSKDIPPQSSPAAEEGTRAHDLAERILRHEIYGDEAPADMKGLDGEALDAVDFYVQYCLTRYKSHHIGIGLIEETYHMPDIDPQAWGTADFTLVAGKTLTVIDYKHGAGVYVDAAHNMQGLYYLLAAKKHFKREFEKFEFVIVQPRHERGGVSSHFYTREEIGAFEDKLKKAIWQVRNRPYRYEDGDHCRWCPARAKCPILTEYAQAAASNTFSEEISLTDKYEILPRIRDWIKAVEEEAIENIDEMDGYEAVPRYNQWRMREDAPDKIDGVELYRKTPRSYSELAKELPDRLDELFLPRQVAGYKIKRQKLDDF